MTQKRVLSNSDSSNLYSMSCLRLFSRRALAGFCSAELACITNTPYSDYLLISVVDIQVRAFQEKERLSSYEEAKVTHLWIIHFTFIIWKTIEKWLILRTVFHFQNKFFSRAPTGKAVEIDQVNARIHLYVICINKASAFVTMIVIAFLKILNPSNHK